MKILFAVWEIDPFFKFGGLGDVARSFPAALKDLGVDVRIIIPFYKVVKLGRNRKKLLCRLQVIFAGRREKVEIYEVVHPLNNVPVYFLKNRKYLDIVNATDTFAFFDKAVVDIVKSNSLDFQPDVIHCNDHHTGMIPLLVKENKLNIKTIMTIHNLAYQGFTSKEVLDKLGIEHTKSRLIRWEIKSRQINFLMEGIIHADAVTTVSPTYAREIMTEEFGMGLEELLRGKEGRIFGILNGISADTRYKYHGKLNTCEFVQRKSEFKNNFGEHLKFFLEKKRKNKLLLQRRLGLRATSKLPLSCFIGRLDPGQKGLDILHKMIRKVIDSEDNQFVILGSGNIDWQKRFEWLYKFYPKYISCNFKFDEGLAHEIYEASDFILIPSKFEPCGLIQMLGMYFGTIPIAHRTGGLADSIKTYYNGFLFDRYSSVALRNTYERAVEIWKKDRKKFEEMVVNALNTDFSWDLRAKEYRELYEKLISGSI